MRYVLKNLCGYFRRSGYVVKNSPFSCTSWLNGCTQYSLCSEFRIRSIHTAITLRWYGENLHGTTRFRIGGIIFIRWFKFTLKPPYTVASWNLLSAIWDTSHWTSFVKFGLKTAWDISYDILWPILKYVNFWRLQGCSSNLSKKDAFRKSIFSPWRSDEALTKLGGV